MNDPENNDNDNEPMGSEDRFSKDSTYPPLSNIDEDGLVSDFDSTCSIRGSSTAGEEEEGTSTSLAQRVRPLKVTWQDLSEAVDSWKINADEDLEETTGESTNGKKGTYSPSGVSIERHQRVREEDLKHFITGTTTTPPYSVLKLLPRLQNHSLHGLHQGSGSRSGSEGMAVSRQSLFDQEINAEGQARVEITSYIDSLVDRGSYEEGYGWVWPLEDYRREGWSREMVRAYPGECAAFVGGGGRQGQLGDATYSGHGGRE